MPPQALVEKTDYGMEIHWLSGKEIILGPAFSKEGDADSLLRHEKSCHY